MEVHNFNQFFDQGKEGIIEHLDLILIPRPVLE
jgi:hypothetical protein